MSTRLRPSGPVSGTCVNVWVPKSSSDNGDSGLWTLIAPASIWELGGNSVGTGRLSALSPPWWRGFVGSPPTKGSRQNFGALYDKTLCGWAVKGLRPRARGTAVGCRVSKCEPKRSRESHAATYGRDEARLARVSGCETPYATLIVGSSGVRLTRSTALRSATCARRADRRPQPGDRADDDRGADPASPGERRDDDAPALRRGVDRRRDDPEHDAGRAAEKARAGSPRRGTACGCGPSSRRALGEGRSRIVVRAPRSP